MLIVICIFNMNYSRVNESSNDGYDPTKKFCIDHIYNTVNLSSFKYELIIYKNDEEKLKNMKYYVSPNYSGSNCLLVFAKIKDKYKQFYIDRKTLVYDKNRINYNSITLENTDIKLDTNIYLNRGSIFDGVLVKNKNGKTFIITDVYMFKGQDMTNTLVTSKLKSVSTYLKNVYKKNSSDELQITTNSDYLYNMSDFDNVTDKVIPSLRDFLIKGVCFYPEQSGTRLIFMFDNDKKSYNNPNKSQSRQITSQQPSKSFSDFRQNSMSDRQNTNNINNNKQSPMLRSNSDPKTVEPITLEPRTENVTKQNKIYVPKSGTDATDYVFEMQKTEDIDVYKLNILQPKLCDDGVERLKRIKVGFAFVSPLKTSTWCREIMDKHNGVAYVNCKYHEDKNKWEPVSIAENVSKPSLTSAFEERRSGE